MGYPEGVAIKNRIVEVLLTEFVTRVKNRCHVIMGLNSVEPLLDAGLEFGLIEATTLFHVEYRREIATLKRYTANEEIGLKQRITLWLKVMISPSQKALLAGLGKVGIKGLVG